MWVKTCVFISFLFVSSLFSSEVFQLANPKCDYSTFYQDKIFYQSDQNILSKIDMFGREEWSVKADAPSRFHILFNRIYLKTVEGRIACYSAKYGTRIWESHGNEFNSFSIGNLNVYTIDKQGAVHSLDMETGGLMWKSKEISFRSVLFVNEYNGLLAESVDGRIYKLDLSSGIPDLMSSSALLNTQRVVIVMLGTKLLIVNKHFDYDFVSFLDEASVEFLREEFLLNERTVLNLMDWVYKNSESDSKWIFLDELLIKQNDESSFFVYNKDDHVLIGEFDLVNKKGGIQFFFKVDTKYGLLTDEILYYLKKKENVSK
ncbi:PQQ-binding-like beta-propeller repeat protein [bacterium]|jgi:hypothetical protein|nr:PQQ-binding-like beta-propeller repeat protein [bacterium]